ncbi:MAG: thioesterase [Anaerovoracaceae bacterium]|nr:thioesterase [Bacillota bacterium]MDY2670676.1 thioesterase [Anaerovoracaceae bacterium]
MFTSIDSRVRYSEADESDCLSVKGVFDYLQDCCTFQSEDAGQGVEALQKQHRAWILAGWHLKFNRLPAMGEQIRAFTWPHRFREYFAYRCHSIESPDGELMVIGNSEWIFVDTESGRPKKVPQEQKDIYTLEKRIDMPFRNRRIVCKGDFEEGESFTIRRHQIDTNGHTNNAQYVAMAADCLPEGFAFNEIRVEYRHEAVLGDLVIPRIYKGDDKIAVELIPEEGKAFAAVEFIR